MIDFIQNLISYIRITHSGYTEHFIGGLIIGTFVAFFIFKKTKMFWAALFMGIFISSMIGLFKELIDPYMNGDRDKGDLIITFIGGVLGAILTLLVQKKKARDC